MLDEGTASGSGCMCVLIRSDVTPGHICPETGCREKSVSVREVEGRVGSVPFHTPGIYADGYIVFVFPFVHLYVRLFVRS